jgi:hypothetical protein
MKDRWNPVNTKITNLGAPKKAKPRERGFAIDGYVD